MTLIALRKLSLQTSMPSSPLGLHVWFLVKPFVYFHTLCVRTVKALARLRSLAWAFAVRLCDKYNNLMSWLELLKLACNNKLCSAIDALGETLKFSWFISLWPEPQHDKTNKMSVRPVKTQISLDIHQVWSVFALCMKKPWVLSYPLSTQRRLWSDWTDAQADLSLRWAHTHFVGLSCRGSPFGHIKEITWEQMHADNFGTHVKFTVLCIIIIIVMFLSFRIDRSGQTV